MSGVKLVMNYPQILTIHENYKILLLMALLEVERKRSGSDSLENTDLQQHLCLRERRVIGRPLDHCSGKQFLGQCLLLITSPNVDKPRGVLVNKKE